MDGWSLGLWAFASAVAVTSLIRLMLASRSEELLRLQSEWAEELALQERQAAEAIAPSAADAGTRPATSRRGVQR